MPCSAACPTPAGSPRAACSSKWSVASELLVIENTLPRVTHVATKGPRIRSRSKDRARTPQRVNRARRPKRDRHMDFLITPARIISRRSANFQRCTIFCCTVRGTLHGYRRRDAQQRSHEAGVAGERCGGGAGSLATPGEHSSFTAKNAGVIKLRSAVYIAEHDTATLTLKKAFRASSASPE